MEDHKKKDCPNTLIPCPRGCNNGSKKVFRRNVEAHLQSKCHNRPYSCTKCQQIMEFRNAGSHETSCPKRQYTCPHCNEAGVYDELTTTHLTVCPKVEIECSKCSIQLLRCYEPTHHLVCDYEPVTCKYYNIGCREKPLRKDLSRHEENASFHLELAVNKITKLVSKNTLTFKVTGFEQKKDQKEDVYSSCFFTSEKGYKMCVSVHGIGNDVFIGTHVSIFAQLMKGDHDDTLTWPFTGSITFELLNQLEDKNHYKYTVTFPADHAVSQRVVGRERGLGWGIPMFISHAALDYDASANRRGALLCCRYKDRDTQLAYCHKLRHFSCLYCEFVNKTGERGAWLEKRWAYIRGNSAVRMNAHPRVRCQSSVLFKWVYFRASTIQGNEKSKKYPK